MSLSPSMSRSPSPVLGGKLQPLQGSAISDLSGFLAAESANSKADEKKLKKAQWRSRQGLGVQEGVDPDSLKREMNDKQKSNREYILLMNKLKKDEAAEGK
jgi:IK cytokine